MSVAAIENTTVAFPEVNITGMTDIHGIKAMHAGAFSWWVPVVLVLACAAAYALGVFLRRAKKVAVQEAIVPPHEKARRALEELAQRLSSGGVDKEFFVALTGVLRGYIEERFGVRAQEMTSEEFITQVREAAFLNGKQKNALRDFFGMADLIKFAKQAATDIDARHSLESVRSFVDETAPQETTDKGEDL